MFPRVSPRHVHRFLLIGRKLCRHPRPLPYTSLHAEVHPGWNPPRVGFFSFRYWVDPSHSRSVQCQCTPLCLYCPVHCLQCKSWIWPHKHCFCHSGRTVQR
uniref:Uncharacterized protein n=1 Tax=Cacopsylla melanoneura TaxID=428564 RepID=A0A8D8YUE9_9HEMI